MSEEIPEEEKEHAVIDGVMQYVSPTSMQMWRKCNRKYHWRYVQREKDKKKGKGAIRGTEGHDRMKHYLTTGENVLDPLERLGVERGYVPLPGKDLIVEQPLDGVVIDGDVRMKSFADCINPRPLNAYGTKGLLEVIDWKFKKSIELYGTKPEWLIDPKTDDGLQMLAYAYWCVLNKVRFPGLQRIRMIHVTFQTQDRRDVVQTKGARDLPLAEVAALWQSVSHSTVQKMKLTAAVPVKEWATVPGPANTNICDSYGGCHFKDRCYDRLALMMAKMNKKEIKTVPIISGRKPVAVVPAAAPTPSQPAPQAVAPAMGPLTAKGAEQGARYLVPRNGAFIPAVFNVGYASASGTMYSFTPENEQVPLLLAADVQIVPLGVPLVSIPPEVTPPPILPPDAPASKPELAAQVPAAKASDAAVKGVTPQTEAQTVAVLQASIAQVTPTAAKEGPVKKRRASVKKDDEVTEPAIPAAVLAAQETYLKAEEKALTKTATDLPGIFLYRDCVPMNVAAQSLLPYVLELDEMIKKQAQVEIHDLRATDDNRFSFMRYKSYFATVALENPPPPGHYIVVGNDERVEAVFTALMPKAFVVLG